MHRGRDFVSSAKRLRPGGRAVRRRKLRVSPQLSRLVAEPGGHPFRRAGPFRLLPGSSPRRAWPSASLRQAAAIWSSRRATVNVRRAVTAARESPPRVETFSLKSRGDWQAFGLRGRFDGGRALFGVPRRRFLRRHLSLSLAGPATTCENALAAIALCHHLGIRRPTSPGRWPASRDSPPLRTQGTWRGRDSSSTITPITRRRCTRRSRPPRRSGSAGRRLWCVFQPHQIRAQRLVSRVFARACLLCRRAAACPGLRGPRECRREQRFALARNLRCRRHRGRPRRGLSRP